MHTLIGALPRHLYVYVDTTFLIRPRRSHTNE